MKSTRRSPVSIFATKLGGLRRRLATCLCVSLASARASWSFRLSAYKGRGSPFLGAGIGGYGDVYFDDKVGFELGYNTLFQNQLGGSSAPGDVERQNISYLAYVLKYKPHRDHEYGIGGGQFDWNRPAAIFQDAYCTNLAKTIGSAPVSAAGLILQAGFPIKHGKRVSAATTLQFFYVPGDATRLFGVTAGIGFGWNLFTGKRVPLVENKSGAPRRKTTP